MTNNALQPNADLFAGEKGSPCPSPPDFPTSGALLRALLAGAVALLVMLLPAQPAASRAGFDGAHGCSDGACSMGDRAVLDGSPRWRRTSAFEISRHDNC